MPALVPFLRPADAASAVAAPTPATSDPRPGFARAWPCAAAVAAGLLTAFTVSLVGLMPVGELVLMAVAGWTLLLLALNQDLPGDPWRDRAFLALLAAQGVATLAYVVSDLYRGSSPHDMARGWGRMVFLAIDLVAVVQLLVWNAAAFVWLALALQAGLVAAALVHGPLFGDWWKFGVGTPITFFVLWLAGRGGPTCTVGVAAGLGLLHFMLDYRSLGLGCLLVGALAGVQAFPRAWRAWLLPAGLALGVIAVAAVYAWTRDEDAQRASRSNIDRSSMMLAAAEAVVESPLLGQGSWFNRSRVMDNYLVIRDEAAREAGIGGFAGPNEEVHDVALHSQLLVALAEAGLFGGAFFLLFALGLAGALLHEVVVHPWHPGSPLRVLVLCLALFNVALSPFSGAHRVHIALAAGLVILIHDERRRARAAAEAERRAQPGPGSWPLPLGRVSP